MIISKTEIINKIDKLITIHAKNTLTNHIRYTGKYFFDRNNEQIIGQTTFDTFVLWQYNHFWGAIFYPVIYGRILIIENQIILRLKTRLNLIGKIINTLIIVMMSYTVLPNCFIYTTYSFEIDFKELILSMFIIIGCQTVPFAAYWTTRYYSVRFIKEYINNRDGC